MSYRVTESDPAWALNIEEFEKAAAIFFKAQNITTDAARAAFINGASQAVLNNIAKALYNCMQSTP